MSKLSIITVCLNEYETIDITLRSIANQTFQDFDWIVVDGASSDGTLDVINRYKDRITLLISESDNGVYDAMNKGIMNSQSEYLYFMNGGDYVESVVTLENVFSKKPSANIVYGDIIDLGSNNINPLLKMPNKITKSFHYKKTLPHQSTFIKRSLFDIVGLYDETYRIAADYDFTMRAIFRYKCTTQYIDEVVAVFSPGGISADLSAREKEKGEIQRKVFSLYEIITIEMIGWIRKHLSSFKQAIVRK